MVVSAIIDTGAMLALLDQRDRWHEPCARALQQIRLPLLTSEAVLTELFHLVGGARHHREAAWRFVHSGVVVGVIETHELRFLTELMDQYWDRPMDFADATLVYLAKREQISTIFTVDLADFSTYRIDGKRRFQILPERQT